MTNRRAKIAAGATVVGLAALGGAALGSNPGMPATQLASNGHSSVATGASGAAALPATQNGSHSTRPPIVTRASGGAGGIKFAEED